MSRVYKEHNACGECAYFELDLTIENADGWCKNPAVQKTLKKAWLIVLGHFPWCSEFTTIETHPQAHDAMYQDYLHDWASDPPSEEEREEDLAGSIKTALAHVGWRCYREVHE